MAGRNRGPTLTRFTRMHVAEIPSGSCDPMPKLEVWILHTEAPVCATFERREMRQQKDVRYTFRMPITE